MLFLPEVAFDAQPVGDKERKDADRHLVLCSPRLK